MTKFSKLALSFVAFNILVGATNGSSNDLARNEDSRDLESTSKIVGGTNAPIDEYPWFAGASCCGGTLVSPEFVLTAAHCNSCISQFTIGDFCRGSADTGNNCGQTEYSRSVIKKYPHPSYNSNTMQNDFSLMKLSSRVPSGYPIAEMDLGNISSGYSAGKPVWTLGFGTLSSGGSTPVNLKHVEVSYVSPDTCQSKYLGETIDSSMMCAADPGEDSCQGDSGGPLYDKVNQKLVGVVSWGWGCAYYPYPGVYSRIGDQATWIKDTICNNHSDPKPAYCTDGPTPPSPTPPSPTPPSPTPPSPTPPSPTPPSDSSIMFKNKVAYNSNLCMAVKGVYGGAPAITKSCSSTDSTQKFVIDGIGRIKLKSKPTLCLKKSNAKVVLASCKTTNIFKWAYNSWDSRAYQFSMAYALMIANDTPGVGRPIRLAAFNKSFKTQGWELI